MAPSNVNPRSSTERGDLGVGTPVHSVAAYRQITLALVILSITFWTRLLLDLEGGSQKATLVVLLLVVVISSLKIPKAFLIRSAERNETLCTHSC